MTPTEIREAVARLVESCERLIHAEEVAAAFDGVRAPVEDRRKAVLAEAEAAFEMRDAMASARPALSALASKCVLDVETVRELVAATCAALDDLGWEHCIQHGAGPTVEAALAAAEAELTRAEGER